MKRIQGSDEHLRASVENPFIHGWGTIIHGCELSTNGVQQMQRQRQAFNHPRELVRSIPGAPKASGQPRPTTPPRPKTLKTPRPNKRISPPAFSLLIQLMVVVVSREKKTKALIQAYVVKSLAETNDPLKIRAISFVFISTRRVTMPLSVLNPERVLMPRAPQSQIHQAQI